jgi:hypothetical protein
MPRPQLELRAPARDAAIGIEAVDHGADAVYIGGPGLGARDKAAKEVADIARLAVVRGGRRCTERAAESYARHCVKVIGPAYESHEALGEVPLMITKHCVRFSLSLCAKQAKGVAGVQGTLRAEPLTLVHGDERLTLRLDCKPCEMHVVGAMRPKVLARLTKTEPLSFDRTRPGGAPRTIA